jgi:hypothetical protein
VPLLFAATLFLSASLLFMVQPMVGKMILPLLGGSPAVWNACMVFFQVLLLLGYQYSHFVTNKWTPRKQWLVHLCVLAIPLGAMVLSIAAGNRGTPIAVAESLAPSGDTSPFLAVMALMSVAIGLPFFVASTTTPLIQKWFTYTGHPMSKDPYFLNAVGNAGSLISLLGYPLFIEPNLSVSEQTWVFAGGFALLAVLLGLCGLQAANPLGAPPLERAVPVPRKPVEIKPKRRSDSESGAEPSEDDLAPPSTLRVLKWIALAFVPSSWMLGVTFVMTTDIASVPLLWVVPLALYLVTFIIAFSRMPSWFRMVIGNLAPVMILLLVFVMASGVVNGRPAVLLMLHILTFFNVAMMCHYELAIDRPKNINYLTKYFLMMSVGGVLGGLFNALIAPLIFPLAYEYKVVIVIGCLMVPRLASPSESTGSPELIAFKKKLNRIFDFLLPAITGFVFWLLVSVVQDREFFAKFVVKITSIKIGNNGLSQNTVVAILLYAVPVMACFFYVDRPFRFALAVAVILGISTYREEDDGLVYTERTFFGILKVETEPRRPVFTRLVHGTTLHGTQINRKYLLAADTPVPFGSFTPWDALALEGALASWDPRQEPLTYYHRTGPVGAMFRELRTRKNGVDAKAHVAMIGLGTGSVSCYALPGQRLTFYEIDSGVRKLVAEDDRFFSYVKDAERRGAELDFRMGDARLKIKEDADRKYALLLVDAFSSDSIPVHLLTKEAVKLYTERMTDDGILALHISNKYIALEPVVAKIAKELNLAARVWNDDSESRPGKTASSWVVLAKDEATLGSLAKPAVEQVVAFGTKNFELVQLLQKYGPNESATTALKSAYGDDFLKVEAGPDGKSKESGLALEDFASKHGGTASQLVEITRRANALNQPLNLGELADIVFGPMFRRLKLNEAMPLWTDDYSDVLRVMMLKEVQAVRKFFGLPTLDDE